MSSIWRLLSLHANFIYLENFDLCICEPWYCFALLFSFCFLVHIWKKKRLARCYPYILTKIRWYHVITWGKLYGENLACQWFNIHQNQCSVDLCNSMVSCDQFVYALPSSLAGFECKKIEILKECGMYFFVYILLYSTYLRVFVVKKNFFSPYARIFC